MGQKCKIPPEASDRVSAFVGNGDADLVTGARRTGRSELLAAVMREVLLRDPSTNVIELRDDGTGGDLSARIAEAVDGSRSNCVVIDSVFDVRGWEETIGEAAKASGTEITAYCGQDLCHQVPACIRRTFAP